MKIIFAITVRMTAEAGWTTDGLSLVPRGAARAAELCRLPGRFPASILLSRISDVIRMVEVDVTKSIFGR